MKINIEEAFSCIKDNDSIKIILEELYINIDELQAERDQLKIKVLAYKVAKAKYKKKANHSFVTDNFNITWRDNSGRKQNISKSFNDGGNMKIIIRKVK